MQDSTKSNALALNGGYQSIKNPVVNEMLPGTLPSNAAELSPEAALILAPMADGAGHGAQNPLNQDEQSGSDRPTNKKQFKRKRMSSGIPTRSSEDEKPRKSLNMSDTGTHHRQV